MNIEKNNKFLKTNFSNYPIIGFHATTSLASGDIEKTGFLPNKIFDTRDHQIILAEASSLNIYKWNYEEWLKMGSVTFTNNQEDALNHISEGNSGGQGLHAMEIVLQQIDSSGNYQQKTMANNFINKIKNIRNASAVIYAVDLSNIVDRLVTHECQPNLYQIYFDLNTPLPSVSIVTPANIIARLDVV